MAEDFKPPGQQLDSFWGGFRHQDPKLGISSPKTPIFCNLLLSSLQGVPKTHFLNCRFAKLGLRVGGLPQRVKQPTGSEGHISSNPVLQNGISERYPVVSSFLTSPIMARITSSTTMSFISACPLATGWRPGEKC